jgi:pimeloyl-ACP methyl ester carboxylesterase
MTEYLKSNSLFLWSITLLTVIVNFALITAHFDVANAQQNNTLMQSQRGQSMTTNPNNMSIVLVHGVWVDGSSWSKVIPLLQNAGHKVIAVQLPLQSLSDDVATVKRAIDLVGGPVILVGHSYGGFVITNAAYNNPNVKGLVYIAAFAPNEGQSLSNFVDTTKLPKVVDSGGFIYINPDNFRQLFAQDIDPAETKVMAATQKPANPAIFTEKSGPPAWKQIPSWYQVSENDHAIPPDAERMFAKQINATTILLTSSHVSPVSHPNEVAQLILNATRTNTK